ncbi:MAG: hypothetical protein HZA90_17465 [Verrucomicrobia bacterium]|nr:hypothetical protein [Verrucomicrobiota bacterium]
MLSFLAAAPANAADIVWANTAGGNGSAAANWNPNQVFITPAEPARFFRAVKS